MKNLANRFRKLSPTEKLLHLAPIVIWFSYFPNFQIGRGEGMNFEFSLPLIFAVIFCDCRRFRKLAELEKFDQRSHRLANWNFHFLEFFICNLGRKSSSCVFGFGRLGGFVARFFGDFELKKSVKNPQKSRKNLNLLGIFDVDFSDFSGDLWRFYRLGIVCWLFGAWFWLCATKRFCDRATVLRQFIARADFVGLVKISFGQKTFEI